MKKIILSILLTVGMTSLFGQITIDKKVDEMTDEVSYQVDGLICANEEQTKGFAIYPNISVNNGNKEIKDLIIQMVGLSNCNENNTMILLFKDGSKTTLNSWNKFNCKGTTYFNLKSSLISKLSNNEISKIRLTNGDSYKNYTHILESNDSKYFIQLFEALRK